MYGCVNSIHHEIRLVAQATIYRWISYWKSHSENQVGKLTTNKSRPRHRVVQMVRMHQQLREQKQPPGFGRRLGDGLTYGWRSCSTHIWHAWNGLRGFNGMVFSGFIAWGTWKIREACDLMDFWTPKPNCCGKRKPRSTCFLEGTHGISKSHSNTQKSQSTHHTSSTGHTGDSVISFWCSAPILTQTPMREMRNPGVVGLARQICPVSTIDPNFTWISLL